MRKEVIPVLLAIIFGFQGEAFFSAFLPLLGNQFTDNELLISSLSAIYYLSLGVFGPFWGSLSDILGRRKIFVMFGLMLFGLALFFGTFASDFIHLIIVRAVAGIGGACFTPTAYALITDYSNIHQRGTNIGHISAARSTGWVTGSLLGGLTGIYFGIQGNFLFSSGLVGVGIILSFGIKDFGIPDGKTHLSKFEIIRNAIKKSKDRITTFFRPPVNHYLRRPGMTSLYLAIFLRNLGTLAIFSLVSILFAASAGDFPVTMLVGLLYVANTGTQSIFMSIMGHVADRIGRRRLIVFGFAGSTIVLWIFAIAMDPIMFFVAQTLTGISFAALDVGSKAIVADNTTINTRGEALGFIDTARNIGAVIGILILGVISSVFTISLGIAFMSIFAFGAAVIVVFRVPETFTPKSVKS